MRLPECDRCRGVTPPLLGLSPAYIIREVGSTRYTKKDKPIYVRGATARLRDMAHGCVCIWYVTRYVGKRIVQWVPLTLGVGAYHAGEP